MPEAYIIGVSMTPFGRYLHRSVKDMGREAIDGALADAGVSRDEIGAIIFSNVIQGLLEGQNSIRGQVIANSYGFAGTPVLNVENACASGTTALQLAATMVKAGEHEIVLALGVEKMTHEDKAVAFAAHRGGWDVHDGGSTFANLEKLAPNPMVDGGERRTAMMDVYAVLARHHMNSFGTTQRQMAVVAAKNHDHSVYNEKAQYRIAMSADEILAAREISWPLTLPMCSPISDGGSAAIVCSEQVARRLGLSRAIRIRSATLVSGTQREAADLDNHIARRAALLAYEQGGVGPQDMDVCEVHDATSFAELLHTENLGFCARGDGGPFAESGATRFGGAIPINLSGGLVSRGHPVGATGLAQVYELARQLRGEGGALQVDGARLAIAENGGGFIGYEEAAACITILERAG